MGDRVNEPKLVSNELIDRLQAKGIDFNLISKEDALNFLEQNNNYFKLTSYRKNFPTSEVDGRFFYIGLDFMHLVTLSRIDMILRYLLVKMCLDIEHSLKVNLMNDIENNDLEDGYTIVDDYLETLDEKNNKKLIDEIKRNVSSIYYHRLLRKHNIDSMSDKLIDFPVWAFVETISFGSFLSFYSYYLLKNDKKNSKLIHLLNKVKQVRNAAAHNTCMLNNLYAKNDHTTYKPNQLITSFLGNAGVNKEMRDSKLSNEVLYQISIVFYIHNEFVKSKAIKSKRYSEFYEIMDENLFTIQSQFVKNDLILSSFEFLHKISVYLKGDM